MLRAQPANYRLTTLLLRDLRAASPRIATLGTHR